MDCDIKNRVAVVCGASKGIGFASARALAAEGVNLLMISRTEDDLLQAQESIRNEHRCDIEIISADVTEKDLPMRALELAKATWGKIDILVNNAGGPPMGSFLDHDEDAWDMALDQNLKSVIRFATCFAPLMIENKWGRIINITSSLAKEPTAQMVLSATARAGVSAFSKSISNELAVHGVTVNTLCPGGVLTDRLQNLIQAAAEKQDKPYDELLKQSQESIPINRFAEPEEFADMLVFLASERGRYITGTSIMVDGGLTKGVF